MIAVSLFNTILLLWLGLTLWLNADVRDLGIVLASSGFLLAGLFFISHSALILSDEVTFSRSNTLWLAMGMVPALALPYLWYVVLFWFADYWSNTADPLHRQRRYLLFISSAIMALGFVCLLLFAVAYIEPLAFLSPTVEPFLEWIKTPILGIPLVVLGYLGYLLFCVILSLDALRQPAGSNRLMGEVARRRARPWLVTASLLLLGVGVLVAVVVLWTITNTREGAYYVFHRDDLAVIGRFDLAIALLIAAVTVLLGQAMTAYEVFTGRPLPRQGLARQWRRAIILAGGYGVLIGGALVLGVEPIYAVLLTVLLMTTFFALLSWRSYRDWEQMMSQLRPFVASQRWYDALVDRSTGATDAINPFDALCGTVLNTSVAYLLPAGPTAAFVLPQAYPSDRPLPEPSKLFTPALDHGTLMHAVDPQSHGGAGWAIPLWSERGIIGLLLLGPRADNSLYTQEEMEIARSTGERLIDTAAGIALSQRLMQLQRTRMATTQLLDQRTRRALHDDVLPLIHTAMLALAAGHSPETASRHLADAHQEIAALLRELPMTTAPEIKRLGLVGALQKMVSVEFAPAFDEVIWHAKIGGEECAPDAFEMAEVAARMTPTAAETVYYAARELVRNAAKYARIQGAEAALRLTITACVGADEFALSIVDNGVGFQPGGSSGGSPGHGLVLHSTMMAVAGGALVLESTPGLGTRAKLLMPLASDSDGG